MAMEKIRESFDGLVDLALMSVRTRSAKEFRAILDPKDPFEQDGDELLLGAIETFAQA